MIFCGRWPLVEDKQWWKTAFGGRRPSVEDVLRSKTNFGGRQPLVEDNRGWKTTFGGRRPYMEDTFWWKTTFGGRQPSVEDDLPWKMTFCGKQLLVEDDFAAFFLLWEPQKSKMAARGRHLFKGGPTPISNFSEDTILCVTKAKMAGVFRWHQVALCDHFELSW